MSDDREDAASAWYHRHKSMRFRLVNRLSKLTKGRVRSPLFHASAAYHRESDLNDLEKERVSTSEHVQTWSLWTAEFYTPNNINSLYDSLERLEPAEFRGPDRDPAKWLRRTRALSGSSFELYLTPKGQRAWGVGHYCELPAFADQVAGTILCVTPSLTMLVMHFLLKDDERQYFDEVLHQDHPTRVTQNPSGSVSMSSPALEQRRLVRERREQRLMEATAWHRAHFPGLLSTHDERVSICEYSTVEGAVPHSRTRSNLLSALDLDWSPEIFEGPAGSERQPFLLSRSARSSDPAEMYLLSSSLVDFRAQDAKHYGLEGDRRFAALVDDDFRHSFARLALLRVLRFYASRTAEARDGAANIVGSRNASKALARVRADTAECMDASVIARELRDAAKDKCLPRYEMDFTPRTERTGRSGILSEILRKGIIREAESLLGNVDALNDGLHAQANLLSAHANLKLQPWIIGLALLSLIAGLIAAVDPAMKLVDQDTGGTAAISSAAPMPPTVPQKEMR